MARGGGTGRRPAFPNASISVRVQVSLCRDRLRERGVSTCVCAVGRLPRGKRFVCDEGRHLVAGLSMSGGGGSGPSRPPTVGLKLAASAGRRMLGYDTRQSPADEGVVLII